MFLPPATSSDERVHRHSLPSRIILPIETKSRNDTISELKRSETKEDAARNKRFFGKMLAGTLTRFTKEEKKVAPTADVQVQKQMEVEKRLETTKQEERDRIQKEKMHQMMKRREQEMETKRIRREKAIEYSNKEKVEHFRRIQNFILTSATPPIFWLPKEHTPETRALLEKSATNFQNLSKALIDKDEKMEEDEEEEEADKSDRSP